MENLFLQVITSGRLWSIVAGLIGLISIIIGRLALVRSNRPLAIAGLVAALICVGLGLFHLATTSGPFGTGSGRAGAILASVLGVAGLVLSGRALRTVSPKK